MKRIKMPGRLDKLIFRNSASRTKAVNRPSLARRGGIRL